MKSGIDRISLIRKLKKNIASGSERVSGREAGKTAAPPVRDSLPGWEKLSEFVYRRREYIYLDFKIPHFYRYPDILFYDTETTGLSSGAGTFIFLLGMAGTEDEFPGGQKPQTEENSRNAYGRNKRRIVLEQVLLADYPGEPDFLEYIYSRFKRAKVFISFNGKSYDSHLMQTRFLMNGRDFKFNEQYDLLHISRRLWSRVIGRCTLKDIEENILGIHRHGDLPGYEVPERYFAFLKTGNVNILYDVFKHNRQDVLSMVVLLDTVVKILSGENTGVVFDYASSGSYLSMQSGAEEKKLGEEHLKKAFGNGDLRAGRFLSIIHKRRGEWDRAVRIWLKMTEAKSFFAVIELSKYYEHRKRDYRAALMWTDRYLSWGMPLSVKDRRELNKRRKRLTARAGNNEGWV
ncbi:MAG: hypothetical protein GXP33_04860 [Spirochaetes bacterium]|nr:hypothetical protein [Spirochaetota bacterium]